MGIGGPPATTPTATHGLALGSYAGAQANLAGQFYLRGTASADSVILTGAARGFARAPRRAATSANSRTGLDGGREAFKTRRQGGLKSPDDFLRFGRLWPFSEVLNN